MTLIDAQNEVYQSLLEEGDTDEEVLYVLQRRQHKALGKALENINLKE